MAHNEPVGRQAPRLVSPWRQLWTHSLFRYGMVGGLSFIVDFGLVWLLHVATGWPLWLATACAFIASFGVNYTLQRLFSFSSRARHGGALVRYSILVAANTVFTVALVSLFDTTIVGWGWGKVIATILTTVGNYFAYRMWIFPPHRNNTKDQ
ncbi:GtrA family protein [Glaciihabitans sp. UYNi722]|uniref:GtrA family protein n=1 Tax=Glaciihabitans sp. UYNi722 TaxID=3156344 RepID=UPI00339154F2